METKRVDVVAFCTIVLLLPPFAMRITRQTVELQSKDLSQLSTVQERSIA